MYHFSLLSSTDHNPSRSILWLLFGRRLISTKCFNEPLRGALCSLSYLIENSPLVTGPPSGWLRKGAGIRSPRARKAGGHFSAEQTSVIMWPLLLPLGLDMLVHVESKDKSNAISPAFISPGCWTEWSIEGNLAHATWLHLWSIEYVLYACIKVQSLHLHVRDGVPVVDQLRWCAINLRWFLTLKISYHRTLHRDGVAKIWKDKARE